MSLFAFSLPAAAQSSGQAHWVVTFQCQGANTGNPDFSADPNPGAWPATVTPDPSDPGIVEFDETSEIPGGSGALSADSSGSVTPVLTWTPGYTGDTTPPPTTATAKVCSEANASDDHYGWQSPGSTHEESDGQKDSEENYAYSYFSSGAHVVTQDNSAGNTTVKLMPLVLHAKGTYPSNGNSDTIFVDVSVDVYPIVIDLTGTTPANNLSNILVGQGCGASLDTAGLDTPGYQWTVDGTTFQSWTASSSSAVLSPNDGSPGYGTATNATIHWFWSDTASTKTVKCSAMVTPPGGYGPAIAVMVAQKVNLEVPSIMESNTPGRVLLNNANPGTYKSPYALYLGPADDKAGRGIQWNGMVNTPSPFSQQGTGTWEFAQIITPTASRTPSGGAAQASSNNGLSGCDGFYPYGGATYPADNSPHTSGDSPGFGIQDAYSNYQVTQTFRTCIMYQPPPASTANDVMMVPLWEIDWNWTANVTETGGCWANWPAGQSPGSLTITSSQAQTTHPTWEMLVSPPQVW